MNSHLKDSSSIRASSSLQKPGKASEMAVLSKVSSLLPSLSVCERKWGEKRRKEEKEEGRGRRNQRLLGGCAEGQFLHLGGLESHPPQRHSVGGVGGEGAHAHAAHHVGEEQGESEGVAVADSQHGDRGGGG